MTDEKSLPESTTTVQLFDAASAAVQAGIPELDSTVPRKLVSVEHWEVEYKEACMNVRHQDILRNQVMTFWGAANAFLLTAVGAALGQLDKNPWVTPIVLTLISIAGAYITKRTEEMEDREMEYFKHFAQRCRVLEASAGFYGQHWRTWYWLVVKNEKKSRILTMGRLYKYGATAWNCLLIITIIATVSATVPAIRNQAPVWLKEIFAPTAEKSLNPVQSELPGRSRAPAKT